MNPRLKKLLTDLETSPHRIKNAPHISPQVVREILETSHIHLHLSHPQFLSSNSISGAVVLAGDDVHRVQVNLKTHHHYCIDCGGYCNASTAALINELANTHPHNPGEKSIDKNTCPVCKELLENKENKQ